MNGQADLFERPLPIVRTPASRRDDPETSHVAEARINRSGLRESHRARIFAYLASHPGATVGEISRGTGLDRAAVSKRMKEGEFSEASPLGMWRRGPARDCSAQHTRQLTWSVA